MSELSFDSVSIRYGSGRQAVTAVEQVDLTVPSGQVVGLVGESGSGKSTLARAAVGLVPVADGDILLDGVPVQRLTRRRGRRPLQMVFQDPYSSLDPRMSIGESVVEAVPRSIAPGAAKRRTEATRLLELVGLDPARAEALPGQLSGGQRQRVALARALGGTPDVIIADEITSALDVSIQGTVLNLVRSLQERLQQSMLFISHNLAVVRYVSDIIAVMYMGQIVECGRADDVLSSPQHPYTQDLLSAAPHHTAGTALVEDAPDMSLEDAEPPDPHHPPPGCRFHPRCPVGPERLPERDVCRGVDPMQGASMRQHHTACHFAAPEPTTEETGP
ncbi:MAG: ABC transporter ATP-binding protein [Nocardioidaceae bacterium]